ncbi:MAG TPA: hypothetical protein VNL77_07530, partial [Roseiflexaceae bacterium]|nr:hypothetical protein [Roseiflexaceae bacterium]
MSGSPNSLARLARAAPRALFGALRLALILAALAHGAHLVFRPDPLDALRRADALFAAGRYHDALAAYRALAAADSQSALVSARLGMVHAVRGELPAASRALGSAVHLGLDGQTLDLVRLYQGRVADAAGIPDEAAQFWGIVGERSPLHSLRRMLEAERL